MQDSENANRVMISSDVELDGCRLSAEERGICILLDQGMSVQMRLAYRQPPQSSIPRASRSSIHLLAL